MRIVATIGLVGLMACGGKKAAEDAAAPPAEVSANQEDAAAKTEDAAAKADDAAAKASVFPIYSLKSAGYAEILTV